jgi:hypothetical protein
VEQNRKKLSIVNVRIEPASSKKPQSATWLTRKEPKPKL